MRKRLSRVPKNNLVRLRNNKKTELTEKRLNYDRHIRKSTKHERRINSN